MTPYSDDELKQAWERFRRRRAAEQGTERRPPSYRQRRLALPAVWMTAAVGLLLAGVLGFSPAARSATLRVLSLFQVGRIAALPVDEVANAPLDHTATADALRGLIANHLRVTRMTAPAWEPDAAAASEAVGFAVRTAPVAGKVPRFRVQGGAAMQVTIDRARTQDMLESAGVSGVDLPENVDGATVGVTIPRGVAVLYGDCGAWANQTRRGPPAPPDNAGCTVLIESPSPTVSLPPGLDMGKIAEVGLQLLGWTPEQAAEFCKTVDWSSTLVVPFPSKQATSATVKVDGVQGVLFTPKPEAKRSKGVHYLLLWSRAGMLYSIAGSGSARDALALAAGLRP